MDIAVLRGAAALLKHHSFIAVCVVSNAALSVPGHGRNTPWRCSPSWSTDGTCMPEGRKAPARRWGISQTHLLDRVPSITCLARAIIKQRLSDSSPGSGSRMILCRHKPSIPVSICAAQGLHRWFGRGRPLFRLPWHRHPCWDRRTAPEEQPSQAHAQLLLTGVL